MLQFDKIKSLVTVYGAPLFSATPTVEAGVVKAGEYTIVDGTLSIETPEGVMYIPVRSERKAQGMDETQEFRIGVFTALRSASGTYNGKEWSIEQGNQKVFAY